MTEHCILYRNPSNDKVGALMEDEDHVAVFPDALAAMDVAEKHTLCMAWGYQIVCLDEL